MCIDYLSSIRWFGEFSLNYLMQATLHDFCENGHYDKHVNKMNRVYKRRMAAALTALQNNVPAKLALWYKPKGEFLIWLLLQPCPYNYEDIKATLIGHGVNARFGQDFFVSQKMGRLFIRLSIASLKESEIVSGIKNLAKALKVLYL